MSLPSIPDINPDITLNRCESINLLLSSIAMEEIALSHILNAEGEKIQYFLKRKDKLKTCDFFEINKQVNNVLRTIVKSQLLLQLKLEDVVEIIGDTQHSKKHRCKKSCNVNNPCANFRKSNECCNTCKLK